MPFIFISERPKVLLKKGLNYRDKYTSWVYYLSVAFPYLSICTLMNAYNFFVQKIERYFAISQIILFYPVLFIYDVCFIFKNQKNIYIYVRLGGKRWAGYLWSL